MKAFDVLLVFLLATTSTTIVAQRKDIQPYLKGDARIAIKLPHINYLSFYPNKEFRDSKFGFNGYGIGFGYSYKANKFFEANLSLALTFELPFPAPIDAEYNKYLSSMYFYLTDNVIHKRFTFGYGLSYTSNIWNEWTQDLGGANSSTTSSRIITNYNLGLALNAYYRLGKTFHLGLIYNPSLVNFGPDPRFIYEHSISVEAAWRIKVFGVAEKSIKP